MEGGVLMSISGMLHKINQNRYMNFWEEKKKEKELHKRQIPSINRFHFKFKLVLDLDNNHFLHVNPPRNCTY